MVVALVIVGSLAIIALFTIQDISAKSISDASKESTRLPRKKQQYRYSGDGQTRTPIPENTPVATAHADPGKEAVLTDPSTFVDYDKGAVSFRCQSCQYWAVYMGDVEIPKGGVCACCSSDRQWLPLADICPDRLTFYPVADPDIKGIRCTDASDVTFRHCRASDVTFGHCRVEASDPNGNPDDRSYPTVWENDLEKRKELLNERVALPIPDAKLAKQHKELEDLRKSLMRCKERLDRERESLVSRQRDVITKEILITAREERVKPYVPAWARDALWGMSLSGIGLAFAWVAIQIF